MSRPPFIPPTWKDKDSGERYAFAHAWAYRPAGGGEPIGFVARYEHAGKKLVVPFFDPLLVRGTFRAGAAKVPRPLFGLDTLGWPGPLFVVEGEKPAAALHALGLGAVSAPGGSRAADRADWKPLLEGRTAPLLLWPDDDEPGRAYAVAVWDFIEAAEATEAARCLIKPPAGTPAVEGADAADWLAAALGTDGRPWDGLGPLPAGVDVAELRERLLRAMEGMTGPLPASWRPPEADKAVAPGTRRVRPEYVVTRRGTFRIRYTKEGAIEEQLSNFAVRITEEAIRDDGRTQDLALTLAGEREGAPLAPVTLTVEQFRQMLWPMKAWGTACLVYPGQAAAEHLRHAIQVTSHQDRPVRRRTVYTHTGWRNIGGAWCYLSAGGAIGAAGMVEGIDTDLGELSAYALPAPSSSPAEALAAARASLAAAECAPPHVAVPLVGAMFVAPFSAILDPDMVLWLEGPSRTRKSSYAALMLAHFGPHIDRTHLPANWHDTANNMEYKAFILKDAPLVIDDYAPQASQKAQADLDRAVQRLIRNIGNRAHRGRQRADMTQSQGFPPRAFVLATAEQYPGVESAVARLFGVTLTDGEVNMAALTAAQEDARRGLLARAMADFLRRVAADYPARTKAIAERWRELRADAMRRGLDGRLQEQAAFLMAGYEAATEQWTAAGAITEQERDHRRAEGWTLLLALANHHGRRITNEQPADVLRRTLLDLFAAKAVFVRCKEDGGKPVNAEALGWSGEGAPGEFIGWHSDIDKTLYLLSTPTLTAVHEASRKSGNPIAIKEAPLWRQCESRGFLRVDGSSGQGANRQGYTTVKWIAGQARRVLAFDAVRLLGLPASA